ncbi:hypothetical protein SAMN05216201_112125 [Pseudomonas linyingensis]|uniref:DUF5801 domain-containing protein n=1 Tax=Pseudomonas linyingensis TaxID=915471 RepID=A0A1H7AE42_9PSED|nr:hypothetical protein [Pseudomonas linyingensis]SEJ62814.1 hypothetical protein SAMN05216201_112125 [Pseudomonas linyingensis]
MAIELNPGVTVTVDETDGLQNLTATPSPAEDANDNDILLASLPSAFSSRLTTLGAGTASALDAALSGYTGAAGNTGSNAFTITADPGAGITDISFVDSGGVPLNGLDSGLDTLDGTSIYLYTDATNNNILLGRAGGATGDIVFAAYIEETGSPVTGGKIWTVLYEPLKHPDTSNPDDALNLLDKVFIGASQNLEFSLANAPSGQNLFLMFTTADPTVVEVAGVMRITDPTIIATGKDPANQSTGVNITTGDTINTSQAGGPTTFGTNNQMIVEQEGIRFTFVTGARQDVTIPNLDQNEADLESNIDFTAMFNARKADFDVVQLQSGKSAQVKISAFTTAAEPGVNFIDGYANDTAVAITNVRVIDNNTGLEVTTGIAISIVGGVASITGVKADYKIEYTTATDHNRVLIENGAAVDAKGNNHADFDIGGFTLLQVSTATAEIGSRMIFEDDGPSLAFGNLVGTGTDLAQYGFWNMDAGADGPDADDLQIALTGFQLGGVAQAAGSFSLTEGSPSPDGSGNYIWNGSLSGDFNNDGTVDADPLTFTLTALSDGTYALDLTTPVQSTTTIDTADGGLGAGGPDPVQTLFIPEPPATPTETVVFFSAKIDASAASIAAGIILGATDPTEAQLEGPPPASFIDPRSMNVSTSGIGVDNNNLNGYGASGNLAVIDDPDGPDNTDGGQNIPSDDSFVVNPGTLVDMVRVFIDNSVTGYDYTGGERLQYRVFYADGTWSNYTTVVGDLGKGALPQFFEIDGAGQKIDAVQLTMLYGEIKIPNIQFVTVTESLAKDISLDFTASLTDADGDMVSSNFSADLFTNEAAGATYDYELIGTTLVEEAFDVDLASTRNDYLINGFDASLNLRDTLVLIGDPNVQASDINIDISGADSIVTVAESGGQTTTITLVGVDLLASDIVIA